MPFVAFSEPLSHATRPPFSAVPESIIRQVERIVGEKIVAGIAAEGGFSAGAAFIANLYSGRQIFFKGSHPEEMAHGAQSLRQEVAAYQTLPVLREIAPEFFGVAADGDEDGWILGVWDFVPAQPFAASHISSLMKTLCVLHADPATDAPPAAGKNYIRAFFTGEKKWRRIEGEESTREKFLSLFEHRNDGAAWLRGAVPVLCALQADVPGLSFPEGLLHGDLRIDNILVSGPGVRIVDWPNFCRGPIVFDLVSLFAHMEASGLAGFPDLMDAYGAAGGPTPSPKDQAIMLASTSGYFADQAYRAVPPQMPRLRWLQRSMLAAQLHALAYLGHIESPPRMRGQGD